jgi:hypothetical protein
MNLEYVRTIMLLRVVVLCDEKVYTWVCRSSFSKLRFCLARHALYSKTLIGQIGYSEEKTTYHSRRSLLCTSLDHRGDGTLWLVVMASAEDGSEHSPRVPAGQSVNLIHAMAWRMLACRDCLKPLISEVRWSSANKFRRRANLSQDMVKDEPVQVSCSLRLRHSLCLIIEVWSNKERREVCDQCVTLV